PGSIIVDYYVLMETRPQEHVTIAMQYEEVYEKVVETLELMQHSCTDSYLCVDTVNISAIYPPSLQ
ncbi:Hypothetical predicted protein, partial [Pelobates cultripes]